MVCRLIRFMLGHLSSGHQTLEWQCVRQALQSAAQCSKCPGETRRILRTLKSGVPRFAAVRFTVSECPLPIVPGVYGQYVPSAIIMNIYIIVERCQDRTSGRVSIYPSGYKLTRSPVQQIPLTRLIISAAGGHQNYQKNNESFMNSPPTNSLP